MQEIKRGEVRVRWGERECEWRGERRMGKKEEKKIKSDWVCVCVSRALQFPCMWEREKLLPKTYLNVLLINASSC
jgi:hypothetical protein